jgi:prophage regulatory protein
MMVIAKASTKETKMSYNIRRMNAVQAKTGYSRSTIYLYISKGLWVKSIRIGERAVGFLDTEIDALNAARISGKSDEEIRSLVIKLEAARKDFA